MGAGQRSHFRCNPRLPGIECRFPCHPDDAQTSSSPGKCTQSLQVTKAWVMATTGQAMDDLLRQLSLHPRYNMQRALRCAASIYAECNTGDKQTAVRQGTGVNVRPASTLNTANGQQATAQLARVNLLVELLVRVQLAVAGTVVGIQHQPHHAQNQVLRELLQWIALLHKDLIDVSC